MAEKIESQEHHNLVKAMVDYLDKEGFGEIKADGIENFDMPEEVNGFVSDASGKKNEQTVIVEAETCDSYISHKDQILAFSRSKNEFWLIVSKQCYDEVKNFYKDVDNITFYYL